jgi:hypothetical protein
MRFTGARIAEYEQIFPAVQKAAVEQSPELPSDLCGQTLQIEVKSQLSSILNLEMAL